MAQKIQFGCECARQTTLQNERTANATAFWAADAISTLSLGSYPYQSSYMTNGNGLLPPYPLRYGCNEYMSRNFSLDNNEILNAFGDFIGVIYRLCVYQILRSDYRLDEQSDERPIEEYS